MQRDERTKTQNYGVVVQGEHASQTVNFYDVLKDIIQLTYSGGEHVYIFKCDWWDISNKKNGIRIDDHFTSINMSRTWYDSEPFILAHQAEQVFYLKDMSIGVQWHVVQRIKPCNTYDIPEK